MQTRNMLILNLSLSLCLILYLSDKQINWIMCELLSN